MSSFFGRRSETIFHEVSRGSNLDLLLRGFNGVANRFVDALDDGLQSIALALSTPHDNSEQVKQQIERLKASRSSLQQSIDQNKGE